MYRLNVAVICSAMMICGCGGGSSSDAQSYTVGGRVTGLTGGTVVLMDNGAGPVSLSSTGSFTLPTALTSGAAFNVTVSSQPVGQTCTVAAGTGTIASAPITGIVVTCAATAFTVGGTITGLTAAGLVLLTNAETLTVPANATSFVFPSPITYAESYSVKAESQPYGLSCVVTNGAGTATSGNVTDIIIMCTPSALTLVPAPAATPNCTSDCMYVDAVNGSDANNGVSPTTAFQTLNKAASVVQPGFTVLIMNGTYTSDGTVAPLTLSTSGTAKAYIEFSAAAGQHPVIQIPNGTGAFAGIHILGASYLLINGIEVVGQNQSITAQQAAGNDGTQALLNENCIFVDGAFTGSAGPFPPEPHDIVISNSSFHDCSGGGIVAQVADTLTIAYNQVYNNGWWTVNGSSGIDIYHLTEVTVGTASTATYRNMILGNLVYNNYNNLPTKGSQPAGIYDGNGLIINDTLHKGPALGPYDTQNAAYMGRTYIANNIAHDNGGRGLHALDSAHIDIVNNTTYNNLITVSPYITCCEIDGASSIDMNIVNNIGINPRAVQVDENDGNTYEFNLWNGTNVPFLGVNDVTTAAALVSPTTGNFTPAAGSPALGTGINTLAPSLDFSGAARASTKVDRGAIQVTQ